MGGVSSIVSLAEEEQQQPVKSVPPLQHEEEEEEEVAVEDILEDNEFNGKVVEIAPGLELKAKLNFVWDTYTVESIDPIFDTLTLSDKNGKKSELKLEQDAQITCVQGSSLSFRGIVYNNQAPKSITIKKRNREELVHSKSKTSPVVEKEEALIRGWKASFVCCLKGGAQGLANLGNTCYMNSTLQALQHCGPFVHSLLELSFPKAKHSQYRLTTAMYMMMQRQWHSKSLVAFRPLLLKNLLVKINGQFSGTLQHDAHEYLVFLLDALHEELNVARKKPVQIPDNSNAQMWWDNYHLGNDSVVKDIFVGQICSRVTCGSCNHTSTAYDPFWSLSVPVTTATTLEQCMTSFCSKERISGYNCDACKGVETTADKQISIVRCPQVLIVHLKRFSANMGTVTKLGNEIKLVTENFNLTPYMSDAASTQESCSYSLVAVINHEGASAKHGHYTADCYVPTTEAWHNYDDSTVSRTQYLQESCIYILFYVKI